MRKKIIDNFVAIIEEIITAGEIIFSRSSLLSKIDRINGVDHYYKHYMRQTLKRWENKNFIKAKKKGGDIFYRLLPASQKYLNARKFRAMKINKEKWDGLWRVVIFDVPEHKRDSRNAIRRKLQNMGFYALQKSVFVSPYSCDSQLEILADYFDILDNIEILLVKSLGRREEQIKKFFEL